MLFKSKPTDPESIFPSSLLYWAPILWTTIYLSSLPLSPLPISNSSHVPEPVELFKVAYAALTAPSLLLLPGETVTGPFPHSSPLPGPPRLTLVLLHVSFEMEHAPPRPLGTVSDKLSCQCQLSPDLLILLYFKFSINALYFKTQEICIKHPFPLLHAMGA